MEHLSLINGLVQTFVHMVSNSVIDKLKQDGQLKLLIAQHAPSTGTISDQEFQSRVIDIIGDYDLGNRVNAIITDWADSDLDGRIANWARESQTFDDQVDAWFGNNFDITNYESEIKDMAQEMMKEGDEDHIREVVRNMDFTIDIS